MMMNLSGSECSSGCESGWTVYFDEAVSNHTWAEGKRGYDAMNDFHEGDHIQVDDEDLSMVSDASSGPPHFQEYENCGFDSQQYCYGNDGDDYYYYYYSVPEGEKKSKKKSCAKEMKQNQQKSNLCLDDTASSSFFHFSKDNVPNDNHDSVENVYGFSQVYSATQFEDESISKKHLSFFKSSKKGKSGSLLGRKRQ